MMELFFGTVNVHAHHPKVRFDTFLHRDQNPNPSSLTCLTTLRFLTRQFQHVMTKCLNVGLRSDKTNGTVLCSLLRSKAPVYSITTVGELKLVRNNLLPNTFQMLHWGKYIHLQLNQI